MTIAVGSGVAVSLGVTVGAGAAVGVGADIGVAVGAGLTGVAVGVGVGLEQAATSAANANKIMRVDSFDMEAGKAPEARCDFHGGSGHEEEPRCRRW